MRWSNDLDSGIDFFTYSLDCFVFGFILVFFFFKIFFEGEGGVEGEKGEGILSRFYPQYGA